jgi:hypothetical protein
MRIDHPTSQIVIAVLGIGVLIGEVLTLTAEHCSSMTAPTVQTTGKICDMPCKLTDGYGYVCRYPDPMPVGCTQFTSKYEEH